MLLWKRISPKHLLLLLMLLLLSVVDSRRGKAKGYQYGQSRSANHVLCGLAVSSILIGKSVK
jgi:hypothetical protein